MGNLLAEKWILTSTPFNLLVFGYGVPPFSDRLRSNVDAEKERCTRNFETGKRLVPWHSNVFSNSPLMLGFQRIFPQPRRFMDLVVWICSFLC